MGARGFIFSLDAFVAFVLIMITISLLIFTIGTPKPYHHELEAAHMLAYDTLRVLSTSGDSSGVPGAPQTTYLSSILSHPTDTGMVSNIMMKVAGGSRNFNTIIPPGYGYKLEYLDLESASPDWRPIYDAGIDGCNYNSDRCGRSFTKLQSSATVFLSGYAPQPYPGESPFCYAGCKGYVSAGVYESTCITTPCENVFSNFQEGKNSIRVVRLTVYT